MVGSVSELQIFKAAKGLALNASLSRTLSHCVFWSQHATQWDGEVPLIWKTGPEVSDQLHIAPRTANRHFKKLAALGYWELSYRPRPGSIGAVTWLRMSERSLKLLALAKELAVTAKQKTSKGSSSGSSNAHHSVTKADGGAAQSVTSNQMVPSSSTTVEKQSFILPSKAGKKGMQEALSTNPTGQGPDKKFKAPGYAKATTDDLKLAADVRAIWIAVGLKEWDWTSFHTWQHLSEIRQKLIKAGVKEDDWNEFLTAMLANWNWLRHSMTYRYATVRTR